MVANVSAFQTLALVSDIDTDGVADPGDSVRFNVTISNSGSDPAADVTFAETLAGMTLVDQPARPDFNVSPIAVADAYNAVGNVTLMVDDLLGVLLNDLEPPGPDYGLEAGTAIAVTGSFATIQGGTVTLGADGSFSYISAPGFTGTDTFTYTLRDVGLDGIAGNADDLSDNATVTIEVGPAVWFIDNSVSGSGGDGTQANPFRSITEFNEANGDAGGPQAGDVIYLATGTGTYSTPDGFNLLDGQTVIGGGSALTVTPAGGGDPVTIQPAGTAPTVQVTGADNEGVELAQNNTLSGFNIETAGTPATDAIADGDGTVGTLVISNMSISGTGQAIDIDQGGTLAVSLTSVSSTDSLEAGIDLAGVGGSFAVTGATSISGAAIDGINVRNSSANVTLGITTVNGVSGDGVELNSNSGSFSIASGDIGNTDDPGAQGFLVNGGTGDVTVGANVSKSTFGNVIWVNNHETGTVTFSGNVATTMNGIAVTGVNSGTVNFTGQTISLSAAPSAQGVFLNDNSGGTINFNPTAGGNGLDITTTSGTGFSAAGDGTVTVQGAGNTITSGIGTALNISNTTIGAAGVTFQSISSNGGSASGIILETTGSSGGLHVTGLDGIDAGTDPDAGSGGTIANKSGADGATAAGNGIYLNSTSDVRLAGMQLNDFENSAIRGFSVSGFSLEDSVISGAVGNQTGPIEGAIAFGDVLAVGTVGLSGNSLIDNVNISGSIEHHVEVYNQTGTLNLTISNSNIHDNSVAGGGDGIQMEIRGDAQAFVNIDTNEFSNNKSQAIQLSALENSTLHATIQSNTITRGTQGNEGVVVSNGGNAYARLLIDGNTISGFGGAAVFVGQVPGQGTAASLLEATIRNNTIISPASATNHAILAFLSSQTGQVSQARLLIDNNAVTYNSSAARAILVDTPDAGTTPNFYATVTNNTVEATDPLAVTMISVAARNGATGHTAMSGNDVNYTFGSPPTGLNVREATLGSNELARGASASNDAATVLAANNPLSTTAVLPTSGDIPVVENNTILLPVTPTLPSTPLLAAESSVETAASDVPQWQAAGIGDFDGDGLADALVLRDDGLLSVGRIDGDPAQSRILGQLGPGWHLVGTGDIDGDGTTDILLQNGDGSYQASLVRNNAVTATIDLELVDGELRVPTAGTGTPADTPAAAGDPTASDPTPITPPHPVIVDDGMLSQAELDWFVDAAIARWSAAGLTAEQLAALEDVAFGVADMGGLYLGAFAPGTITLDADAAGRGWFLDPTPLEDTEFATHRGDTWFAAAAGTSPYGRYDLLTTVMHEMGHVLGIDDSYAADDRGWLMYGWLYTGERRIAGAGEANGAVVGAIASEEFLGAPVDIGTLPAGESVTVQWQATIDPQSNGLIVNPVNQGTASGSNFASAMTDAVTTTLDALTLGGTVWNDNGAGGGTAGNGILDGSEPGVDGVVIDLFVDADNDDIADSGTALATETTDGSGNYSFAGLAPGTYLVQVREANFAAGQPLEGLPASPTTSPEPIDPDVGPDGADGGGDDDRDDDDNGARVAGQGILTKSITLAYNEEPTAGTGNDTNTTLDIAVLANPSPVFEGGLSGGSATVAFGENTATATPTPNGTQVFDVDANDGDGGATDTGLTYAITAGNTDVDGDTTPAFAIDAATGVVTVADEDDLDAEAGPFVITVSADDGISAPSTATLTVNLGDVAETFTVTAVSDDSYDGGGLAAEMADGGGLSLREAIGLTNRAGGSIDTITFAPGLDGGTIVLGGSQLGISTSMTIDGDLDDDGRPDITVSANELSRVFEITGGASTTANLVGLTVSDGSAGGFASGGNAGGGVVVRSGATLNFRDGAITDNRTGDNGGGVGNLQGTVTIVNSTVSGNQSDFGGGGLFNNVGAMTLTNVTVSDNTGGTGGGFNNLSGSLYLTNVTVANNTTFLGGGMATYGLTSIVNSTLTGNIAQGSSGGGGIFRGANSAITLVNSIVLGNGTVSGTNTEFGGSLGTLDTTQSNIISGSPADVFALTETIDPDSNPGTVNGFLAGVLADNGGVVETVAIKAGGPAHNTGSNAGVPADAQDVDDDGNTAETLPLDARALPRIANTTVDIGAFEEAFNSAPVEAANTGSTVAEGGTDTISGAELDFDDAEEPDDAIVYEIAAAATNGTVYLDVTPLGAGDTFTQDDIAAGLVTYVHDGGETTSDQFGFSVSDGKETVSGQTFAFIVTPVNDAPVVTAGAALDYTENDPAAAIDTAVTVSDADDTSVESATVQITGGYATGEDVLGFVDAGGITGSFDAGTGTLTLTGSATLAAYQAALRSVTYQNTSDAPSDVQRTVSFTVNDGDTDSSAATATIDVTPVNDAPVNTVPGAQATDEDTAVVFSTSNGNALSIADLDAGSGSLEVTLTVTNGVLSLGQTPGLTVAGDGTSTVTASGTLADLNAALQGLAYQPDADFSGSDTLTLTTSDNGNTGSGGSLGDTDQVAIAVAAVNDAPTVVAGGALDVTENDPAAAIDATMTVADVDDANIESATVAITGNLASAEDLLRFVDAGGITGSFNAGTGTLTLTGSATLAAYQAALRSVTYQNTSDDPSGAQRTVSFTVNDGDTDSSAATATIDVTPVNDAPVNTVPGAQATNEDTSLVFSTSNGNAISVSDLDAGGGNLEVTLTVTNGVLSLGQTPGLTVAGDGTSTVTASGTLADLNAALQGLAYQPDADFSGPDTLTLTTSDNGNSGTGTPLDDVDAVTIDVSPVNDAPVVTAGAVLAYTENDPAAAIDMTVTVSDADDTSVESATVQITGNLASAEDVLGLVDAGGITGSFNAGTGTLTLTGSATLAAYQAALRSVTYQNTSDAPSDAQRTVSFTVNDGDADSDAAKATIDVTPANDAPAGLDRTVTIAEDTSRAFAAGDFGFSDVDTGDVLMAVRIDAVPAAGQLALSGVAVTAGTVVAAADLASLVFTPAPEASGTGYASFSFSVQDSGGAFDPVPNTLSIDVTPVNDAPTLDLDVSSGGTGSAAMFVEDGPAASIAVSPGIGDVDGTTIVQATLRLTNPMPGDELVAGVLPAGIAASAYDSASGLLTLTGTASHADYQAALQAIAFRSTSDAPDTAPRLVEVMVTDGARQSAPAVATIAVAGVADPGVSVTGMTVAEGDSGTTTLVFTVSRTGGDPAPFTVDYATSDDGATAGSDYVAASGTLAFAAGETEKTVEVLVLGDTVFEPEERFFFDLDNPTGGATIVAMRADGTIVDDDDDEAFVSVDASLVAEAEGDAGTKGFTFTVTRSGNLAGSITATWAVSGIGGLDGADFAGGVLPSGSLDFVPGEISRTITIEVAGDTQVEADELFIVTLTGAPGATIVNPAGTGLVLNDDDGLALAADVAVLPEGDTGTTAYAFTVTRTGDTSGILAADWAVTGADADDFENGARPSGTVSFAAGETVKTITVEIAGDTTAEPDQPFALVLSRAGVEVASAQGVIGNDDPAMFDEASAAPILRLYEVFLGRVPDPGGLDFWAGVHAGGMPLPAIAALFGDSDEFQATYPPVPDASDPDFVTGLYRDLLGREPDAEGLAFWIGLDQPPLASVLGAFAQAAEFAALAAPAVAHFVETAAEGTQDYIGSLFDLNDDGVVDGLDDPDAFLFAFAANAQGLATPDSPVPADVAEVAFDLDAPWLAQFGLAGGFDDMLFV